MLSELKKKKLGDPKIFKSLKKVVTHKKIRDHDTKVLIKLPSFFILIKLLN